MSEVFCLCVVLFCVETWIWLGKALGQLLSQPCSLCRDLGSARLQGVLFCPSLQGCLVKQHLKLNYQKRACFWFPQRTEVG